MDGNEEIKHSFIEVIKVMIMIDDNIHENEIKMFDSLCDLWNVQSELKLQELLMGFIENIIMKAFDVAVEQKQKYAKKRLENDPKLKELNIKLEKNTKELNDYIKKMRKEDPELDKLSSDVGSFLNKF